MKLYWSGVALGVLATAAGIALMATAAWLITTASYGPPVLTLMVAVVAVRTFGLSRPVLRYLERLSTHSAALKLLSRVRARVYDALVPHAGTHTGPHSADLLSRVVSDADAVQDRLLRVRAPLIVTGVLSIVCGVFVSAVHLPSGVALSVLLVIAIVAALLVAHHTAKRAATELAPERARLSTEVLTLLDGCGEALVHGTLTEQLRRVRAAEARVAAAERRSALAMGSAAMIAVGAGGGAVLLVSFLGVNGVSADELSGVQYAVLVLTTLAIAELLTPLPVIGTTWQRARAAASRVQEIFTRPRAALLSPDENAVPRAPYTLSLRHIAARWPGQSGEALREGTLELPPGARVAIVGPSGAGKSTLAAVLLRFLTVTDGSYTVNGVPVESIPEGEFRRMIGLVETHAHIFANTLRENLRLAQPDADDATLLAVLQRVSLTMKLDAWLGEGGSRLSGGERARVSLARALLRDFPVLVLDEPTAHLDHATAAAVMDDLLTATQDRTCVLITHRREGIAEMDTVLRMEAGRGPVVWTHAGHYRRQN